MTSVWSYPWHLLSDGGRSLSALRDRGLTGVAVASHYHSVRSLDPSDSREPFRSFPGGCYFDPGEGFDGTPIEPPVNRLRGHADPIDELTARPAAADLSVTAWLVCLHNTRLGSEHPSYRIESAFGRPHDHALCPSHPAVRTYFGGVARALAARGVDAIGLESIGFPSVLHGHGTRFGHDKHQAVASPREELLLSQCFCDACRAAASFDLDAARDAVRERCDAALSTPADTVPSLTGLVDRDPVLGELFEFRARIVESLVAEIDRASGDVPLTYYAADGLGRGPSDGWPAGVVLDRLATHLDRVTALCYTGDPDAAADRVTAFREATALPVDAGLSLDPEYVATREEWTALAGAVRDRLDGELLIYNEALLTDEQLDWLGAL